MKNQRGRGRGGMRGRGGRGGSRGRGRGKMGGENDDGDGMYGDEMEVGHNSQVLNTKQSLYCYPVFLYSWTYKRILIL